MNFYQHYLGDYDRDTKRLTMLEHGAYRLLIDHCYATEEMPPNEVVECYLICKAMKPSDREAVDKVVEKFFPVNGDGRRHHKRVEEEIAKAKAKSEKARESAGARWGKPSASPDATRTDDKTDMRSHSGGNANQNQKPERTKTSPANAGEGRDGVAAVPDCPHEKLIALYHEALPTCTRMVEWNAGRQALARSRWREKATSKEKNWGYATEEQGLACWRRFFAYVQQSDFLTGRAAPAAGRKTFIASLEWLLKPANFAKVIEGNYHT